MERKFPVVEQKITFVVQGNSIPVEAAAAEATTTSQNTNLLQKPTSPVQEDACPASISAASNSVTNSAITKEEMHAMLQELQRNIVNDVDMKIKHQLKSYNQSENDYKHLQDQHKLLKLKSEENTKRLKELTKETIDLTRERSSLKSEVLALKKRQCSDAEKYESEVQGKEEEIERLTRTISNLEQEIEMRKEECTAFYNTIQDLQNKITILEEEKKKVETQNTQLETANSVLKECHEKMLNAVKEQYPGRRNISMKRERDDTADSLMSTTNTVESPRPILQGNSRSNSHRRARSFTQPTAKAFATSHWDTSTKVAHKKK